MKICVLGCGLRTPLLLHGLIHSGLQVEEIALFDTDPQRAWLMEQLGRQIAEEAKGKGHSVSAAGTIAAAVDGSDFVVSSIRVGGMEARARDERLALECGFAGQETTGPAGFAMALRTIPVALEHARIVERLAPSAWLINFTNPAGIITQAISTHTGARVVGICDTPAELFFQIALALGVPPEQVECSYLGLNHLGWVRNVRVQGGDVTRQLLDNEQLIRRLYPAQLFDPAMIRLLGAIPTEYLFYYYNQNLAVANQRRAGATRGEELQQMNAQLADDLAEHVRSGNTAGALHAYRLYLNRRNASYMRLDGAGSSAFGISDSEWDPFEGVTGYHRIAVSAISALTSQHPQLLVLNVPNRGTIHGLRPDDIVEVPCLADQSGPRPLPVGSAPDLLEGLILMVKQYERLTIEAAVSRRWDTAAMALTMNPIVGSWSAAREFLQRLQMRDPAWFSGYSHLDILPAVRT